MTIEDLPLGFSFALAQNPEAMEIFATLPENKQAEVLQKAHSVSSKEEMRLLVKGLSAKD